jgi:hypothetical protein
LKIREHRRRNLPDEDTASGAGRAAAVLSSRGTWSAEANGGPHTRRGEGILEREWRRATDPRVSPRDRLVRLPRAVAGGVGVDRDNRVERRVALVDSPQVCVEDFRGNTAVADGGRESVALEKRDP